MLSKETQLRLRNTRRKLFNELDQGTKVHDYVNESALLFIEIQRLKSAMQEMEKQHALEIECLEYQHAEEIEMMYMEED